MNQTFAIGISFLAATLAVFGALYLVDQSFHVKASKSQYPMQEIKGSVGPVSPIEPVAPPLQPCRPLQGNMELLSTHEPRAHILFTESRMPCGYS